MAGTAFPIDRHLTARLLGFAAVYPNSIDAVSDRDFIVEFLSNSAMLMMHISRLAEELVIWSSQNSSWSNWTTPTAPAPASCRRKTPMPEPAGQNRQGIRQSHRHAHRVERAALAYNKDLEDKEGMFDTAGTVTRSLGSWHFSNHEGEHQRDAAGCREDYAQRRRGGLSHKQRCRSAKPTRQWPVDPPRHQLE